MLCLAITAILTHWGQVTHICVSKLTVIGSDNGLSPDRCQAIIWANAGLLLIGPLGTNFSEILIEILTFSFKKMRLKMSSAKRRTFCLGLNMLRPDLLFMALCGLSFAPSMVWLAPHRNTFHLLGSMAGPDRWPSGHYNIVSLAVGQTDNAVIKSIHCWAFVKPFLFILHLVV